MAVGKTPSNLQGLLKTLAEASRNEDQVSVRDLRDEIGRRSFAPLLLATSIVGFTPIGGIPGVATTLAVLITLIAAQIVLGFKSLWLPHFLLDRKVNGRKLEKAVKKLQPAARVVDKAIMLRDNGPSYLATELADWLAQQGMSHTRGKRTIQ